MKVEPKKPLERKASYVYADGTYGESQRGAGYNYADGTYSKGSITSTSGYAKPAAEGDYNSSQKSGYVYAEEGKYNASRRGSSGYTYAAEGDYNASQMSGNDGDDQYLDVSAEDDKKSEHPYDAPAPDEHAFGVQDDLKAFAPKKASQEVLTNSHYGTQPQLARSGSSKSKLERSSSKSSFKSASDSNKGSLKRANEPVDEDEMTSTSASKGNDEAQLADLYDEDEMTSAVGKPIVSTTRSPAEILAQSVNKFNKRASNSSLGGRSGSLRK